MQKDQRHQVLIAVHDEARCFLRTFGIDHFRELDALFTRMTIGLVHLDGLVGHHAHGKAANTRIPTDHGLAIFRFVFVEAAAIHDAGDDLLHIVGPRRI